MYFSRTCVRKMLEKATETVETQRIQRLIAVVLGDMRYRINQLSKKCSYRVMGCFYMIMTSIDNAKHVDLA